MTQPRDIIGRCQDVLGHRSLAALARELEIDPSAINAAIRQRRFPDVWLYKVAYKTGVRIEWLETGEEPRYLSEAVSEERALYHLNRNTVLPLIKRIHELTGDERETLQLFLKALRSGDQQIKEHLINQMKVVERALTTRRSRAKKSELA